MNELTNREFADVLRSYARMASGKEKTTKGLDAAWFGAISEAMNEAADRSDRLGDLDDERKRK